MSRLDTLVRSEIGLTPSSGSSTTEAVMRLIRSASPETKVESCPSYLRAIDFGNSNTVVASCWRLVHFGEKSERAATVEPAASVSSSDHHCYKSFRLISPIIQNEGDIKKCATFLKTLQTLETAMKMNSNVGFRLRVSAHGMSCEQLVKLCQNFVKYEDAIDSIVPQSRRTGSVASNSFFASSKSAICGDSNATNKRRNDAIAECTNVERLVKLMNPGGRCYKLNLGHLLDLENHPAIEFRQHSSTANAKKIGAWIDLCLTLMKNSARFRAPAPLRQSRTLDEQFNALFDNVIKKDYLHDYYLRRRAELAPKRKQSHESSAPAARKGARIVDKKMPAIQKAECGCCFGEFEVKDMCSCQGEGHLFCKTCVCRYAEEELFANQNTKLMCMSIERCSSELNTTHLERVLPARICEKFREVQYFRDIEAAGNCICECPKCGCKGMVPNTEKTFSCPKACCRYHSCRQCSKPAHEPWKCGEVAKHARTTIEESMSDARIRKCPQCRSQFVRADGCNLMTCPRCHTRACYICRNKISGSAHFGSRGCPLYSTDMTDRPAVKTAGKKAAKRLGKVVDENKLVFIVERLL